TRWPRDTLQSPCTIVRLISSNESEQKETDSASIADTCMRRDACWVNAGVHTISTAGPSFMALEGSRAVKCYTLEGRSEVVEFIRLNSDKADTYRRSGLRRREKCSVTPHADGDNLILIGPGQQHSHEASCGHLNRWHSADRLAIELLLVCDGAS